MKKLIFTAIFLIAISSVLSAQTTIPTNGALETNKNNSGYVDVNQNAVCDNYENKTGTYKGNRQRLQKGNGASYGRGTGQCRSTVSCNRRGNGRRS